MPHAMVAVEETRPATNPQVFSNDSRNDAGLLMLDVYAGWYRELLSLRPVSTKLSAPRIDVVVKPVGWLGTFSLSPQTGLWYRGDHSTHLLGNWGA